MVDNLPFYVAEFRRWSDAASDEERDRLVRGYADFLPLFPDVELLRNDPANVIAPNRKLLGECTGTELSAFADWYRALRDAAVARSNLTELGHKLSGLRI